MLREVNQLYCVCHMLSPAQAEIWDDYRFIIHAPAAMPYTAYRTVSGLRYFMDNYGLTVDRSTVQVHDMRSSGRGRVMTFSFLPRRIKDQYFWRIEDVPQGAQAFVGLENGSYVTMYALKTVEGVRIYRPNPNAKEVYRPHDYNACRQVWG